MKNPKLEAIKKELESLTRAEQVEPAHHLLNKEHAPRFGTKVADLSVHAGKVPSLHGQEIALAELRGKQVCPVDGMEWQEQVRAEWDR